MGYLVSTNILFFLYQSFKVEKSNRNRNSLVSYLVLLDKFHNSNAVYVQVVKRGVLQAQDELRRESDNQIWQEGILRLPLLV